MLKAAILFGLSVYVTALPFLALSFRHPFFRERLNAWLRLGRIRA